MNRDITVLGFGQDIVFNFIKADQCRDVLSHAISLHLYKLVHVEPRAHDGGHLGLVENELHCRCAHSIVESNCRYLVVHAPK